MNTRKIIRKCAIEAGSARKLAAKTGYGVTSIGYWIRGMQEPRFSAVANCLNAVGLDLKVVEKDECKS